MKSIIDKILGKFIVVLLAIMVAVVLWQIFSRYVLQSPSDYTDELSRFLLIWIGILGAAYASGQKLHLSINLLNDALQKNNQVRLKIIHAIIIIAFVTAALIIGGSRLVYITYYLEQYSPALNISQAIVYAIIPVSGLIICMYKIMDIVELRKDLGK